MKSDIFGRPLAAGDLVVIRARGYRALVLARVIKCTPKRVTVVRINDDGTDCGWTEYVAMAIYILPAAEATLDAAKTLAQKLKENDV